jgi:hypothetical protein
MTKDNSMNMNNMRVSLAAFAVVAVLLGGCTKDNPTGPKSIVGSGRIVSQQLQVSSFSGIRVTGTAKVFIQQDTAQSLRLESDDNIIGRITTSVNNGVLLVGLEQGSYSNVTINVYASMKSVEKLETIGAAEFVTVRPIIADDVLCSISGAGKITLSGTTSGQTVQISGAGEVHNGELFSANSSVVITGTGSVEVNVTRQLDAVISGSGSIVYLGNPQIVNKTVTGIGTIRQGP